MDLPVFWYIQSEILLGAISTRRFPCVNAHSENVLFFQIFLSYYDLNLFAYYVFVKNTERNNTTRESMPSQ